MRKPLPFIAILLCLGLGSLAIRAWVPTAEPGQPAAALDQSRFLLCFWNVENFFDDRDDHRTGPGDREYDGWFARDPAALNEKLDHLCRALLSLNDGKGPDIIALAEVESVRAAELLRAALNARLPAALAYGDVVMRELDAGRHIAPALITRLPVQRDRTRLLGKRQRILESRIVVAGHELNVIASHWTSQLKGDSEAGRTHYAERIYGEANAIYHRNPAADILVCGDFNEPPDGVAITGSLHALSPKAALGGPDLVFVNLLADKDARLGWGTHYYRHWLIYDQFVVSPGLFDNRGWRCDPASVKVINTLTRPTDKQQRPWRFGGEKERGPRGFSDHFPVTVTLCVQRPG